MPVSGLAVATFYLAKETVDWIPIAFIYLATLALYNIHRLVGLEQIPEADLSLRHTWTLNHKPITKALIGMAVLGLAVLLYWFSWSQLIILAIPGVIAAGYTLPIFKKGKKIWRLRDVPFIKIWLVSFTVSFITTYFPLSFVMPFEWMNTPEIHWMFVSRVFFIFAITIPFDIRDLTFDSTGKINTVPMLFGIERSKQIGLLFLLIFACISFWQYKFNISSSFALLLSALISGWIINYCNEDSDEYYYSFLVEGTMLIQFGLVYLAR